MKKILLYIFFFLFLVTSIGAPFNFQNHQISIQEVTAQIVLPEQPAPQLPGPGQAGYNPPPVLAADAECQWWNLLNFRCVFGLIAKILTVIILAVSNLFVSIGGTLLNHAFNETVVRMAINVDSFGIGDLWAIFRDIGNIVFIFLLIYIAIRTIIGKADRNIRQTLATIILVAIFINFSLFFTKVIIDTSNIFAVRFYSAINAGTDISGAFMNHLKLTTIFRTAPPQVQAVAGGAAQAAVDDAFWKNLGTGLMVAVMGGAFAIITAFVFVMMGILLVIRFVTLIFLMITSPLAYVGMILPKMEGYAREWWKMLISNAIFAPVLTALLWVTLSIMNSPGFQAMALGGDLAGAAGGVGVREFSKVFLSFAILIGMMVASMVVARNIGLKSSNFATKFAGKLALGLPASLLRNTVGRGANKFANSDTAKRLAANSPLLGKALQRGSGFVAKSSFDVRNAPGIKQGLKESGIGLGDAGGKGGYAKKLKDQTAARVAYGKELGKDPYLSRKDRKRKKALEVERKTLEKDLTDNKTETEALREQRKTATTDIERKRIDDFIAKREADRESIFQKRDNIDGEIRTMTKEAPTMEQKYASEISKRKGTSLWIVGQKNKLAAKKIQDGYKKGKDKKEKEKRKAEYEERKRLIDNRTEREANEPEKLLGEQERILSENRDEIMEQEAKIAENIRQIREREEEIKRYKADPQTELRNLEAITTAQQAIDDLKEAQKPVVAEIDRLRKAQAPIEAEHSRLDRNVKEIRKRGEDAKKEFDRHIKEIEDEIKTSALAGKIAAESKEEGDGGKKEKKDDEDEKGGDKKK